MSNDDHSMYQSAVSGLWYSNPYAAGSIKAVRPNGFASNEVIQLGPLSDTPEDARRVVRRRKIGPFKPLSQKEIDDGNAMDM